MGTNAPKRADDGVRRAGVRVMPLDDGQARRDAELLAAYAAGDAVAARALIEAHAPRLLALARRMLGNEAEAEEVVQEAMLRLWRNADRWRPGEARVSTWLYAVARNLGTDRLRRARAAPMPEGWEPPDPAPGAAAGMQDRARAEALRAALNALPERQRAAIEMRHLDELPNPEIAEIMGVSIEAVESLQARGRRRLKEILSGARAALGYEDEDHEP